MKQNYGKTFLSVLEEGDLDRARAGMDVHGVSGRSVGFLFHIHGETDNVWLLLNRLRQVNSSFYTETLPYWWQGGH